MDVSNMLASDASGDVSRPITTLAPSDQGATHAYPTRQSQSSSATEFQRLATPPTHKHTMSAGQSPSLLAPKNITFELNFDGTSNVRGRLPMRVQILPHDPIESIVTTVKNFYGLYDSGVTFEDVNGNLLVANFENLNNNMTVYVRVGPGVQETIEQPEPWGYRTTSPQRMQPPNDIGSMLHPQPAQILNYGQPPSRPGSRISRKQSTSPKLSQTRIGSIHKSRSRSGVKSQGSSFQAGLDELNNDAHNGFSDSDGGAGSVTSSRKARSELLATAEISVDNILEGGRRQKAKFESSELPLFVPPQVPAPNSISSISPQRRPNGLDGPSPFAKPAQRPFYYQIPDQPPSTYIMQPQPSSAPPAASPFTVPSVPNHGHRLRDRTSGASLATRSSLGSNGRFNGSNILPTPDPTVASCISDEDVALQLMRLGDVSNFSYGRTSTSTYDETFSGRADAASSATSNGDSSADESESSGRYYVKEENGGALLGPPVKKQRRSLGDRRAPYDELEYSTDEVDGEYDAAGTWVARNGKPKQKANKVKKARPSSLLTKGNGLGKSQVKKSKSTPSAMSAQHPMSPSSVPSSRKVSVSSFNFQHQLNPDEEDLSSKPRCQRCRKSKKGCDRQRPCQRCKDAGIGIEGCLSEDEGNGRKGRYGRHMGVPLSSVADPTPSIEASEAMEMALSPDGMDANGFEKSKKRKR